MTTVANWSPKSVQLRPPTAETLARTAALDDPLPAPSWIEQPTLPSDKCCVFDNSDELIDIENDWKDFLLGIRKNPPVPFFTWDETATLQITFVPTPGVVPPATLATESWDFGDGTSGGATDLIHNYPDDGYYQVTYTVTDSMGQVGSYSELVQVGFSPPTAAFTATRLPALAYDFDAAASTAVAPATLTSYDWDYGDGTTGTGVTSNHVFPDIGPYTVALTVTDSNALTNTTSRIVYPEAAPLNQPPVAEFDYVVNNLVVTFDGSDSYDVDGTVVSYAWDFGDVP